jgi:DNA-binding Xre family transcriptional regulator
MFKQNFIKLCIERDVAPTTVLRHIGLSNATFSCWTDESVPRQTTLQRIADYFGVAPEDLLRGPEEKVTAPTEPAATSPLSTKFNDLLGQMTLQDLIELQQIMEEKIKNKK